MTQALAGPNIYLAEGQAAALDRAAEAEGVSRAELIRTLIDRAIGGIPAPAYNGHRPHQSRNQRPPARADELVSRSGTRRL